jgi:BRCA1-associated protein
VEVGGGGHRRGDDTCDEESQEKVDSLQLEFTYLLTTQLESQRFYFEERLAAQSKELQRDLGKLHIRLEEAESFEKQTNERIELHSKEKAAFEKKVNGEIEILSFEIMSIIYAMYSQSQSLYLYYSFLQLLSLNQKLSKATAELKDERDLNKHLRLDQEKWQTLVKKLESDHEKYVKEKTLEISELKEQVRDLMFFLEGQQTINDSGMKEEIEGGQVTVGPQPSKKERKKKR